MLTNDITLIVAHPDDEFLFGFPVIKHAKKIVACVDDKTHPTRSSWCGRRSEAFMRICDMVGAKGHVLRYDSGFRSLDVGSGLMEQFVSDVRAQIKDAETIFTHNAWGEYGHLDHILLHQIVRMSGKRVLTTDIALYAKWYRINPYRQGESISYCENDIDFHNKCMDIYRSVGAMGWTEPPVKSCMLIEVKS